eukprot:647946-Amorphochlora_amoeboformis.AAC.2
MPAPKKSRKRYFQGSGSKKKRNKWGVNPAANVQPGSPMVLITCDESKEKVIKKEIDLHKFDGNSIKCSIGSEGCARGAKLDE